MQAALVAAEEVNKAARRRRWTAWGRATLRDEYFGLLHEAQNPPEHPNLVASRGSYRGLAIGEAKKSAFFRTRTTCTGTWFSSNNKCNLYLE